MKVDIPLKKQTKQVSFCLWQLPNQWAYNIKDGMKEKKRKKKQDLIELLSIKENYMLVKFYVYFLYIKRNLNLDILQHSIYLY